MNIGQILSASSRRAIGVLLLAALVLTACGGPGGESWAGVTAHPDIASIYVAFDDHLVAVNPASGASQWDYGYEGAKFFAVPTIVDSTLYIGDYEGRMHALNTRGERQWVYTPERKTLIGPLSLEPKDRVIGAVAVGPDYIYYGLGSRDVVAISRETGEKAWSFATDHGVWAKPLYLPANPEAGRLTAVVYVVSLDKHLYALDPDTGNRLWKLDLGGAAPGDMVYDEARHRIYAGTFVSELVAIDLETRAIVDRFETDDWLWGAPAFDDDVLYVGDLSGKLYAVRVTDEGFEQVWQQALADDAIRATPLVTEDMVIVGSKDKNIYAVSKSDGTNRWYAGTEGEVLTNLVYIPEVTVEDENTVSLVVAGTSDRGNLLVAYNVENGERSWRYDDD